MHVSLDAARLPLSKPISYAVLCSIALRPYQVESNWAFSLIAIVQVSTIQHRWFMNFSHRSFWLIIFGWVDVYRVLLFSILIRLPVSTSHNWTFTDHFDAGRSLRLVCTTWLLPFVNFSMISIIGRWTKPNSFDRRRATSMVRCWPQTNSFELSC